MDEDETFEEDSEAAVAEVPDEKSLDDIEIDASAIFQVDARGLPVASCGLTAEQIKVGAGLFFHNKQREAEEFFKPYARKAPLFALAYATMMALRACMSMEEKDCREAIAALRVAEKMAIRGAELENSLVSWGRWLVGANKKQKTAAQVQFEIQISECKLLTAAIQFLSESLIDKVKAGWNIKAAWNGYSKIWKEFGGDFTSFDPEIQCSIHFGMGLFNLCCSALPPRIIRLIAILGFPSDREFGLEQFRLAWRTTSVRRPVTALLLLFHHVLLQAWSTTGHYPFENEARTILQELLHEFPDGGLFLFFQGRFQRLIRQAQDSEESFRRAIEVQVQTDWKQLRHLCFYELGWCYMFTSQWAEALTYFSKMFEENEWSKGFYLYMMGIAHFKLGQIKQANETFELITKRDARKYGGVNLSVDRYVLRKVQTRIIDGKITMPIPELEIVFLWNGFAQIPFDILRRNLEIVQEYRSSHQGSLNGDDEAVTCLILAGLLIELDQLADAEPLLLSIEANAANIKQDVYVIPFARYELSQLWYRQEGGSQRVKSMMKRAQSFKGHYDFEHRLSIRIHLALSQMQPPKPGFT